MISRVLSVGFMLLFIALAGASGAPSSDPCAEVASASKDQVAELAMGVARAFGSTANHGEVQKQQGEALACSIPGADEVVIVTAG